MPRLEPRRLLMRKGQSTRPPLWCTSAVKRFTRTSTALPQTGEIRGPPKDYDQSRPVSPRRDRPPRRIQIREGPNRRLYAFRRGMAERARDEIIVRSEARSDRVPNDPPGDGTKARRGRRTPRRLLATAAALTIPTIGLAKPPAAGSGSSSSVRLRLAEQLQDLLWRGMVGA